METTFPTAQLMRVIPIECDGQPTDLTPACTKKIEDAVYAAAKTHGLDNVRLTCWVQDVASNQISQHSFSMNFSNFPAAWETWYEQKQSYMIDPVLRAMYADNMKPVIRGTWRSAWKSAQENPLGDTEKGKQLYLKQIDDLALQAAKHHLHSGIYMLINMEARKLVISLASSKSHDDLDNEITPALWQELFLVMHMAYQATTLTKHCAKCGNSLRFGGEQSVTLTKTQAEILRHFSHNTAASTTDIARIQHVSINTINFHLKTIRRKFNKPNASGHSLSNIAKEHGLL